MPMVHPRCGGRAVHKKRVVACVLLTAEDGTVQREIRTDATMTADRLLLRDGLESLEMRAVAMESTGVFWHPLSTSLEDDAWTIILVNAHHSKAVAFPQDRRQGQRMAGRSLTPGTAAAASCIPPAPMRERREWTRYRKTLVQQREAPINRHETSPGIGQSQPGGGGHRYPGEKWTGDARSLGAGASGSRAAVCARAGAPAPEDPAGAARLAGAGASPASLPHPAAAGSPRWPRVMPLPRFTTKWRRAWLLVLKRSSCSRRSPV
jgi:hypothetical protein